MHEILMITPKVQIRPKKCVALTCQVQFLKTLENIFGVQNNTDPNFGSFRFFSYQIFDIFKHNWKCILNNSLALCLYFNVQ